MTLDVGHGRIEWRGIKVREVTPQQMGFPHAHQLGRVDRIRELKGGKKIKRVLSVAQAQLRFRLAGVVPATPVRVPPTLEQPCGQPLFQGVVLTNFRS